jgi:nitrilase
MTKALTKIAAVQMASGPQLEANLMAAGKLIKQAAGKGAQMVVLPENFALMPMQENENQQIAEAFGQGLIQDSLRESAIKHNVWIVAGSLPLKTETDKVTASSLMFDNQGELKARYDKIHLFDVSFECGADCKDNTQLETYHESAIFSPGTDIQVVDTPFGKIGLSICYDLRFPTLYRKMVSAGAEIFLVPSSFTAITGKVHWEALLRARAIENQCYVIAPAQGGYHVNGRNTYGHSMVIDFWGRPHEILEKGAGSIMIELDRKAQAATRKNFPVLEHRKF